MLFNRRCQCGRKHNHEKTVGTDWGDITTRFCDRCWEEMRESERLHKAETAERIRIRKEEEKKQKEYEHLKREVEMARLKKEAEELGVNYKEE